jgi:polyisoprenoid-binding protein YceI
VSQTLVRTADSPLRRLLVPAAALSLSAALVLGAGATYAQDAEEPMADEVTAADGIDGTWTVDTTIGDFEADFSSTWVGFRVSEVLNPGGEVDAVGRTPVVSGQLSASGTVLESAVIEADLTAIVSDRPRRDGAIQRALGTAEFPSAAFVSSGPVELSAVPGEEPFTVSVPGSMTIRDVSQDVMLDLTAQRVGDVVVVVGALLVDFTAFGVTMPTAPIVVSVENEGDLEWQLFFRKDAAMTEPTDAEMDDSMAEEDAPAED